MATIKILDWTSHIVTCLMVVVEPRYWEDACVNREQDTDGNKIPFRYGDEWRLKINIDTGQVIGWPIGTTAEIHYKVADNGTYALFYDQYSIDPVISYEGYVPDCLSINDNGFGDFITITINEDGFIENWKWTTEGFKLDLTERN